MGNCSSCESTAVVLTAKLILQDGRLQEFTGPVRVSHALQNQKDDPTTCFVCNADDMDFDDYVSAIKPDEELQPGNLYFALPLFMLRRPLKAEDMATLAMKASAALVNCGAPLDTRLASDGCNTRKICQVGVLVGDGGARRLADERKRRKGSCGNCEGRRFTSKLNAISE